MKTLTTEANSGSTEDSLPLTESLALPQTLGIEIKGNGTGARNDTMAVYRINPLQDLRWERLVERHPDGGVFHSIAWLEALRRTYSYRPVVYTTTPPDRELRNGIVFCRVESWLTGSRLVSVPFSDHCQPLVESSASLEELITRLDEAQHRQRWRYVELRPRVSEGVEWDPALSGAQNEGYCLQVVDLRSDLDVLFRRLHKSCVQRKIRRAEREKLTYEEGRSEELLEKFYSLLILTRRRHGVPPQPRLWFRNLIATLGGRITIRVASKGGQPIASIVTIMHKDVLTYKYGCSDARYHKLGGTALLFWKAMQEGKLNGASQFDLGRSELENTGLVSFKKNWGAVNIPLTYYRLPGRQPFNGHEDWRTRLAKMLFSRMPAAMLTASGRLLYRHIG